MKMLSFLCCWTPLHTPELIGLTSCSSGHKEVAGLRQDEQPISTIIYHSNIMR